MLPRKPQYFAENLRFSVSLFPLCWNSDSKNSFVTCSLMEDFICHSLEIKFSLVKGSPGGQVW